MSLYIWVNRLSTLPATVTVAPTVAEVYPVAVAEKVAVEFAVAALVAETVTVWPVFQFDGVNVKVAGAADTVVAPAVRATATLTFAVGAADSASLNVAVCPAVTRTD